MSLTIIALNYKSTKARVDVFLLHRKWKYSIFFSYLWQANHLKSRPQNLVKNSFISKSFLSLDSQVTRWTSVYGKALITINVFLDVDVA
jgi:hypothetical protein